MPIIGAFIVPHPPIILLEVGRGEERKIRRTMEAYERIVRTITSLKPDTIILTSPHAVGYQDYFHISPGEGASGDFGEFGAPQVRLRVKYDEKLAGIIASQAERMGINAGFQGERKKELDHGTMVPLYFLQGVYEDFELVRIGLSGYSLPDHFRFGQCIREAVETSGRRVVLMASGDLSHRLNAHGPYGFREEGAVFDKRVTEAMSRGDFQAFLDFDENLLEAAAECGLRSFIIMAGALEGATVDPVLLSYEGTFGVGYAVASFLPKKSEREEMGHEEERLPKEPYRRMHSPQVELARLSLEHYLQTGLYLKVPDGLPEEMTAERAGVFVSLKLHGALRGCIGTVEGVMDSVAEEIIRNAVSAGTLDPRFPRVTLSELPELQVSVDVLSHLTEVKDLLELDHKRFGILVSTAHKSGLLLPDLEGVDTVKDQLAIALGKAGISPREKYAMRKFQVTRYV